MLNNVFNKFVSCLFVLHCRFWNEKVGYTPESRVAISEHVQGKKRKEEEERRFVFYVSSVSTKLSNSSYLAWVYPFV